MNIPSKAVMQPIHPMRSYPAVQRPALAPSPLMNPQPLFAGKGKNNLEEILKEAGDMADSGRSQGIFARMISGKHMPLELMSGIEGLDENRTKRMQAYGQLIQLALRPIPDLSNPAQAKKEAAARVALNNPSPELKAWMDELNLTNNDLEQPVVDAHKIDKEAYVPEEVLDRMKKLGLWRLKIPKEHGGMGFTPLEYDKVVRALSTPTTDTLAAMVSAHSTIGFYPFEYGGNEAQKEQILKEVAKGEFLAAFGLTEPGAGTDLKKIGATARLSEDGKSWEISGHKKYITLTHRSGIMTVFVNTDLGQLGEKIAINKWLQTNNLNAKGLAKSGKEDANTAIDYNFIQQNNPARPWKEFVPRVKPSAIVINLPFRITDNPAQMREKMAQLAERGMHISEPLNLEPIRGSSQALIEFKNFKVDAENVLGGVPDELKTLLADPKAQQQVTDLSQLKLGGIGKGLEIPIKALGEGRAGFGSIYSEAAANAFNVALAHAIDRPMFDMYASKKNKKKGGKQSDMPLVQWQLGDMAIRAAAANAVSDMTLGFIEKYGKKMSILGEAAMLKCKATEDNWKNAVLAKELYGGRGVERDHPDSVERLVRNAWIGLIVEGVNPALKQWSVGVLGGDPIQQKVMPLIQDMGKKNVMGMIKHGLNLLWYRTKGTLHYEAGALDHKDAIWIQRRTKALSSKFMALGVKYQDKAATRQVELIRIADIALDLYTLTAVQLKLKKEGPSLSENERLDLQAFVQIQKKKIDQQFGELSIWRQNKEDKLRIDSGRRHIATALETRAFGTWESLPSASNSPDNGKK